MAVYIKCNSTEFYVTSHAVVTVLSERTKLSGVTGALVELLDCTRMYTGIQMKCKSVLCIKY